MRRLTGPVTLAIALVGLVAVPVFATHTFTDVPSDAYYHTHVTDLKNAGLTAGCNPEGTRYCPEDPVTRAAMAVFLLQAIGHGEHPPSYQGYFADVPQGEWYTPWVEHLFEHEITEGCDTSPRRYCPNSSVSRAEMSAFLLQVIDHADPSHLPSYQDYFEDVPPGQWYTGYAEHLKEHEITAGCNAEGTLYCPSSPVLRGQMAVFLVKTLGIQSAQPHISDINFDAPGNDHTNENGEWVKITNEGTVDQDMTGWSLHDQGPDHTYAFPNGFVLPAGASVKVFTGTGTDSATELYWGNNAAIWNNDGDTAFLRDPSNNLIDSQSG